MRMLESGEPRIALPKGWPKAARSAVVHAAALAHFVMTYVRGWCSDSPLQRVRLASECERLKSEVALLREELRIKDARLARIPALHRPHYPPVERLAILALKAARGWNVAQAAGRFLLVPATIASWLGRTDEEGPDALVRMPAPVNRFPEFVREIVGRVKGSFPAIGSLRIADMLARAGLHLARTTVRRFLNVRRNGPGPVPDGPSSMKVPETAKPRHIISRHPHHTWLADLTLVPTGLGFWVPWLPFALVQRWPFCWWVAVVIDHFSRAVVGHAVFRKEPTADEVCRLLGRAVKRAGRAPKYTITDKGVQFRGEYRAWCKRRGVRPRFGAVGRFGSIAITERFVRTMKDEGLRCIFVPFRVDQMVAEVQTFVDWYNAVRPHTTLGGATPNEIRRGVRPARDGPRFETRARYPARRGDKLRAGKGASLHLCIGHHTGRPHLPVIHLRAA